MFEVRRLRPALCHHPLGVADLKALLEADDLSEATTLPVECASLIQVATMLAAPADDQTVEDAQQELAASLQERLAEQGSVTRHADWIIRQLPDD